MRGLPHLLLQITAVVFLIISFLHYLAFERFILIRLFSYLMPWFLVILVPAVLLAFKLRYYGLLLCLLLPIAYIVFCYVPCFLPKEAVADTGKGIKVVSFNVWSKNTNMEAASRIIESEMPDLLFLQEISKKQLNQLLHHLELSPKNRLKNVSFDASRMLAFLSRFPLVSLAPLGTSRTQIQKLQVTSDDGVITAFNVHFIRGYRQKRNAAIKDFIREQLADAKDPIILAGDFNATSQTSIYREFKAVLNNSHDQAGWGFGFTYPTASAGGYGLHLPAMVRIDHIFTSPHFKTTASNVLSDDGGSDHYPVAAKLLLLSH